MLRDTVLCRGVILQTKFTLDKIDLYAEPKTRHLNAILKV